MIDSIEALLRQVLEGAQQKGGEQSRSWLILRAAHQGTTNLSTPEWQHVARISEGLAEAQAQLIAGWMHRDDEPSADTAEDRAHRYQALKHALDTAVATRDSRVVLRCTLIATGVQVKQDESARLDPLADALSHLDACRVADWIVRARRLHPPPGATRNR